MSLPRKVMTFIIKGPFGVRAVGIAGGVFSVDDVDKFLGEIARVGEIEGTVTQALNASRIAGIGHLVHAARMAIIANENKTGFAGSLPIELICWAAGERQIGRAFDKMGVHSGKVGLAILSIGTSRAKVRAAISKIFQGFAVESDNARLELKREKLSELEKVFSISKKELMVAPVQKIVLERIALLALAK